jgi:hypothetical protein
MHFIIPLYGLIWIYVMMFWCSLQVLREFRVPKKPTDTCHDISEINIKCLTVNNYFLASEWWTTQQLLINDVVELSSIGVREAKLLDDLIKLSQHSHSRIS